MGFSDRLKKVIAQAFTDKKASDEFILTSETNETTLAALDSVSGAATAAVFAKGTFTTVGGDVTETITVTGALSTDLALVTLNTVGASPVTILTAIAATGAITVTLSADPSTDHVLSYAVLR